MVMKVGMVGLSAGNGHPFSFSAIINGYDTAAFKSVGWPAILDYLEKQKREDICVDDVSVTHVWTQDPAITKQLCAACLIPNAVANREDMIGQVDVVIIARDDYTSHLPMARPFLEAGLPVFVDKPLAIDSDELDFLAPYLQSGQLVSGSGFRFAKELDPLKSGADKLGSISLIEATVLNDLEKYGIHMLEAVAGLGYGVPQYVMRVSRNPDIFCFSLPDGTPLILSCLGAAGKTFHLGFYGKNHHTQVDLHNNFVAFRRLLLNFFETIKTGVHSYNPQETISLMRAINTAKACNPGSRVEILQ